MGKGKALDKSITTLKDFNFATKTLNSNIQMYVQIISGSSDLNSALIEVTELQVNLAKTEDDKDFLILRCM